MAERFPDGQLYINLRGFDPAAAALDPNSAVRDFLEALGMAAGRVPDGLEARTGQYRSMLAGRRVLVVLDNARDAEQVRPLLPGTPGCVAVVTSRNQLAGLVAAEGACPVTVGLLTVAEARDLLARRLGPARVAAEPDAVDEIISRCARLPLALAIAAARAATRPGFPLAIAATELHEAGRTLDAFDGDDLATDVRAAFSWSLRGLTDDAARLFRLLGLHPGPDISVPAAASLAGIEAGQARLVLAELTRAHLLAEHVPGRFALHDLLRAYATELARGRDGEDARAAAVRRVLDHYLRTSQHAASVLEPYLNPLVMPPAAAGTIAQEPAVLADALAWFDDERATMLGAVQLAADAGLATHAWQLAWNVSSYLHRRHLLQDQELACAIALDAARRGADAAGEGRCLHRLACSHAKAGRSDEATRLFRQSLERYGAAGDHSGQACVHGNMFWMAAREKRNDDAMRHALQAQDLFRTAGNRAGQVRVLADIGYCQAAAGDYQQALGNCERALAEVGELDEPRWADSAWDTLGFVHVGLGNYQQALDAYRRTAQMCREAGDRFNEGTTLETIGDVLAEAGDAGAARLSWAHALRILEEIGHPDAGDVRRKLARL
jgi:tetratricopeptide (TPR) repeat protein